METFSWIFEAFAFKLFFPNSVSFLKKALPSPCKYRPVASHYLSYNVLCLCTMKSLCLVGVSSCPVPKTLYATETRPIHSLYICLARSEVHVTMI